MLAPADNLAFRQTFMKTVLFVCGCCHVVKKKVDLVEIFLQSNETSSSSALFWPNVYMQKNISSGIFCNVDNVEWQNHLDQTKQLLPGNLRAAQLLFCLLLCCFACL